MLAPNIVKVYHIKMFGPYWMVSISIVFTVLLIFLALIYQYVWPRKKITSLQFVILASFPAIISIFRPGVYESGDFTIHVYEGMSFFNSLNDGIFIPRWGGDLNATYGYPVFLFAYPLPNYLISFFHFFGISFIASLKIFLALSFIFSGVTMFYFMKSYIGKSAGVISSIFYMYTPFHLVDLHFRVAVGEVLAFIFMPLNLLSTYKYFQERNSIWLFINALSLAFIILSHQAVSLSFFPFLLVISFIFYNRTKISFSYFLCYLLSITLGLTFSAFYWIPVLMEKQFTTQGVFPPSIYFQNFLEFIYSPWRFGLLFQGPNGQLSPLIGYTQLFIIFLSIIFLLLGKISTKFTFISFFLLISFFAVFFMMQEVSLPLWNAFPILKNFQFSMRLLALTTLIVSTLAGILSLSLGKKTIVVLCIITILYTILNWGNRRVIPEITDTVLKENLPKSTFEGEGNSQSSPLWVNSNNPWSYDVPKKHLILLSGKATIREIKRNNELHQYLVIVQKPSVFQENTLYFPGWKLYLNNSEKKIHTQELSKDGVVRFAIPKGSYFVTLKFENTFPRVIGKTITLLSICYVALYSFYKFARLPHKSK